MMKSLVSIRRAQGRHWVGDGFPVRGIFSYDRGADELSPFLHLDYAGPAMFPPTERRLGVGAHPHRGFETVTIVYSGEVEHRDSSGGGGRIGPGDVQWMTAGSGLVHEEFHGAEYARRGGRFEMIQLWVNLPRKDKMTAPRYQGILSKSIPEVSLPDGAGTLRVIAGERSGAKGPARTFSPMNVWDIRLGAARKAEFTVKEGHTSAIFVLGGRVRLAGRELVGESELALLAREGDRYSVEALEEATLLHLDGQPLGEPVVGYGPFVMCSEEEIRQAFIDYRGGKMGGL